MMPFHVYHTFETFKQCVKNLVHCWQIHQQTSSAIATQQFTFNICMRCMFKHISPKDLIALKDFLKRCTQSRGSSQQTPKNHSPAPPREIWNKDELYTTPAHLTSQIYGPYARVQERHTCSPMRQGSDASFMRPYWIILPKCIIDAFNPSCHSAFDLSL